MRYHFMLFRMAIIKNLQKINAGEGMEKREPSCTVGGDVNCCTTVETVWKFLRTLKKSYHMIQQSCSWTHTWTKL